MPKKIQIDVEKLKALHAQALSDREIGKRLGVSAATIRMRRVQLGLAPGAPGHRGRRRHDATGNPATKRSEIASAGGNFKPRRKAGDTGSADGAVTVRLSGTALDAIWRGLALETKARVIEKIVEL